MYTRNRQSGFTLIELLVVIGIIGLMSTITFNFVSIVKRKGRDAKRETTVHQLHTAIELFRATFNRLPGDGSFQVFTGDSDFCAELVPVAVDPCNDFKDPVDGSYAFMIITEPNGAKESYYIGARYEEDDRPEQVVLLWAGGLGEPAGTFYLNGPLN